MGAAVRVTAVLCVRNEGAFLLEWLAHHRACGVTDFLVFSNDCEDGTNLMLDRLEVLGWLVHAPNPGPHAKGPQWSALQQAEQHPKVKDADWLIVCDIDEFVNVQVGDRTIPALLSAVPDATAIPLTWRMFGNAGIRTFTDAPITETFTRAAPVPLFWPWRAMMFKTLFRNDGTYRKLGVHRPRSPDADRLPAQRWFDGSGRRMPALYHSQRIFSNPGTDPFRLVQLNHYALGAAESFILKCHRGRPNRETTAMGMDYWVDRNFNDVEDRSILTLSSAAGRNALLADPVLGALHRAAVVWRQARFRLLMAEEAWRSLYGRLLLTPSSQALSQDEAEALWAARRESGLVSG